MDADEDFAKMLSHIYFSLNSYSNITAKEEAEDILLRALKYNGYNKTVEAYKNLR